jgi:hypothetical protein
MTIWDRAEVYILTHSLGLVERHPPKFSASVDAEENMKGPVPHYELSQQLFVPRLSIGN